MKFQVFQSLWGMEALANESREEWSLEEKVAKVAEAGFEGMEFCFEDEGLLNRMLEALKANGLSCSCIAFPEYAGEFDTVLKRAKDAGATHINIQPMPMPDEPEDGVSYINDCLDMAEKVGMPTFFEVHRDRMTTDLIFTLKLIKLAPRMMITADLSHFLVEREFRLPIPEENQNQMRQILERTRAYHGRVASREQIQVQISWSLHKMWYDIFKDWWLTGFKHFKQTQPADATLTFVCELGPPYYAMVGPDGKEMSDRWEEAQIMMRDVRELWEMA